MQEELSERQKAALPKLLKRASRTAFAISVQTFLILLTMITFIIAVNEFFIRNGLFVGIMAFISGISASSWSRQKREEAVAKYSAELKALK